MKIGRTPEAVKHIETIAENCKILSEIHGKEHVAQSKVISPGVLEMEYIEGERFDNYLCRILEEEGQDAFFNAINFYWQKVLPNSEDYLPPELDFYAPDRKIDFDLTFNNFFIRNNDFVFVDYEFLLPKLSKKFRYSNAINVLGYDDGELLIKHGIPDKSVFFNAAGITEYEVEKFAEFGEFLANTITDHYLLNYVKPKLPLKF